MATLIENLPILLYQEDRYQTLVFIFFWFLSDQFELQFSFLDKCLLKIAVSLFFHGQAKNVSDISDGCHTIIGLTRGRPL